MVNVKEQFTNQPSTTVSSGGTTAPAGGSSETWTVASSTGWPTASNAVVPKTQFHVADPALPSEIITVTNISGVTWTVTRGDESTAPLVHAAGFTIVQVVSAGALENFKQTTGAVTSAVTLTSATETIIASYQPGLAPGAGDVFEIAAYGTMGTASSVPTITWTLRWGGVAGTSILSMVTGTSAPALTLSMSGRAFDINATAVFLSATSVVGNLNFWWQPTATTTATGVAANAAGVTVSGSGPLVLTAKWSATGTGTTLTVPAPMIWHAA